MEGDTLAVKLIPSSGCEAFSIGSVVYNQRSRREVALVANTEYRAALLDRIQNDKADVTLHGVYRDPGGRSCGATLLWAGK